MENGIAKVSGKESIYNRLMDPYGLCGHEHNYVYVFDLIVKNQMSDLSHIMKTPLVSWKPSEIICLLKLWGAFGHWYVGYNMSKILRQTFGFQSSSLLKSTIQLHLYTTSHHLSTFINLHQPPYPFYKLQRRTNLPTVSLPFPLVLPFGFPYNKLVISPNPVSVWVPPQHSRKTKKNMARTGPQLTNTSTPTFWPTMLV